jgi:hypothetical protein
VDVALTVTEEPLPCPGACSGLKFVDVQVFDPSGGSPHVPGTQPGNVCGGLTTERCPTNQLGPSTYEVGLSDGDGTYTIDVQACDFNNNCRHAYFAVTLQLPTTTSAAPLAVAVEVNQGVQNMIFEVRGLETLTERSTIPLVPDKDTVIRYYILGESGEIPSFSARLHFIAFYDNGRTFGADLDPNTNWGKSVSAPADPGAASRMNLLIKMRADLSTTLNYVIPASWLKDANTIDLSLEGITGHMQIQLAAQIRLYINLIKVHGSAVGAPDPTDTNIANMMNYLNHTYPTLNIVTHTYSYLYRGGLKSCDDVLNRIDDVYNGDAYGFELIRAATPAIRQTNSFPVNLAVVSANARWTDNCLGIAYLDSPTNDEGVAVTEPYGDVATQEIAHTLGLIHASTNHGEQHPTEAGWPYPWGRIGDDSDGNLFTNALESGANVGVYASPTSPADATSAGQWNLNIIDHCIRLADGLTCKAFDSSADGQYVHDFMTYANNNAALVPIPTCCGNWVSDITYYRIYQAIANKILEPGYFHKASSDFPSAYYLMQGNWLGVEQLQPDESVDTLVISGLVNPDSTIELDPFLRKEVPRLILDSTQSGPYTLKLLDNAGNVLLSQSFDVLHPTHGPEKSRIHLVVPFVAGFKRIVIDNGTRTLYDKETSPNAPNIKIEAPNGGEIWSSGAQTVRWTADDPDGDPLTFLVQYSPDGGQHWETIRDVGPDEPRQLELNVSDFTPSQQGVFRLTASDGFNTAYDLSDGFFSLGTSSPPAQGGLNIQQTTSSQPSGFPVSGASLQKYALPIIAAMVALAALELAYIKRQRRTPKAVDRKSALVNGPHDYVCVKCEKPIAPGARFCGLCGERQLG